MDELMNDFDVPMTSAAINMAASTLTKEQWDKLVEYIYEDEVKKGSTMVYKKGIPKRN